MDNIEAFFEEERRNREAADAQVRPEQRALKAGGYCVRRHEGGLVVISEILDPVAHLLGDRAMEDLEEEEREEMEDLRESYANPAMEHYRFTRSYSRACPRGELGDIHVSVVVPISKDQFDAFKAKLGV